MTSSGARLAPVIETARLRLRGHRADDLAACLPLWNDPIVTRFIGGRSYTQEEVWQRVQRYAGSWVLLGQVLGDRGEGRRKAGWRDRDHGCETRNRSAFRR
jgi:hypothetical protein